MQEKRSFKMHPKLLFDVIQRQAGTLSKAVLEGIMNSVDAGATEIRIALTSSSLDITDDGKGFRNRHEIEMFFETFGQPHEENENKRFGTFRMGRGQLFAFGKNCWRTGEFMMDVDIKDTGLDYQLKEGLVEKGGCSVTVSLYEELNNYNLRSSIDEIKNAVKWVEVPIFLNDTQISMAPDSNRWNNIDDNAYYRFKEYSSIKVYNLGVIVREYGSHQFGCGGEIVSKKQLKLNFARNDIMSDCPVWKEIKKVVNINADRNIRKKKATLNEAGRSRLCSQIIDEEIPGDEARELAIFTDVIGKHWTLERMLKRGDKYRKVITVAPTHDHKGAKLMDQGLAFVLSDETLGRFGLEGHEIGRMVAIIKDKICSWFDFRVEDFRKLTKELNSSYRNLKDEDLAPLEKATIHCITRAQNEIVRNMPEDRKLRRIQLGKSGAAHGWTDGINYICIDRDFLKAAGVNYRGWVSIGQLMLHEYCHTDPDTETHYHNETFYRTYHDSRDAVPCFVEKAMSYFAQCLNSVNKALTRTQLREQDMADNIEKMANKLAQA